MRDSFVARGVTSERTLSALETLARSERIDFNLVGATVAYCLTRTISGDILVFMTGVFEIKQAIEAIRSNTPGGSRVEIFPLHANLTSQEQASVFRPAKPFVSPSAIAEALTNAERNFSGHRKIVVATNVAETSITIDGVVYVVDW
jgi:ATP-dependent RNA helicase DHX57